MVIGMKKLVREAIEKFPISMENYATVIREKISYSKTITRLLLEIIFFKLMIMTIVIINCQPFNIQHKCSELNILYHFLAQTNWNCMGDSWVMTYIGTFDLKSYKYCILVFCVHSQDLIDVPGALLPSDQAGTRWALPWADANSWKMTSTTTQLPNSF